MGSERGDGTYPAGTGWVAGFLVGAVVGVVAWLISGEVILGVILFAATGTPLGVAFEQSLDVRPATRRERLLEGLALLVGIVVLVVVSLSVFG